MKTSNVIFHPSNLEELNALKAIGKALKLKFEITNSDKEYNKDFIEKILTGEKGIQEGNGVKLEIEGLKILWK